MAFSDIFRRKPKALPPGTIDLNDPVQVHKAMETMEKIVVEGMQKRNFLQGIYRGRENAQDYQKDAVYTSIFTQVSQIRAKMFESIEELRSFWLADAILDQIVEDALAPDTTTGKVLTVSSKDPQIQKEIDILEDRFKFDKMAVDIAPEMVAYGEHTLSTKVNPNPDKKKRPESDEGLSEEVGDLYEPKDGEEPEYGLLELQDDLIQHQVIALTRFSKVDGYLVMDYQSGKIDVKQPADYVKFAITNRKLRIDLVQQFSQSAGGGQSRDMEKIFKDIPRFVRVGKSLLYGAMPKIRQLMILEQLVPAAKLQKMVNGTLVGVQLPGSYEIPKAMEACQHIESMLNKKVAVDMTKGEVTIESVMNAAGRFKVVPIMGEKGTLTSMDYDTAEPDDLLSSVDDIRKTICTSIGVPYEILFVSDDSKKGDVIKRYARYLRLLKAIQRSLSEGIKQIVMIHLANVGIPFKEKDIEVSFANKLIEVDSLDRLEFMDASVAMITQIRDFLFDLKAEGSPAAPAVDLKPFLVFLKKHFNMIGLQNTINPDKLEQTDTVPPLQGEVPAAGTSADPMKMPAGQVAADVVGY